MSNELIEGRHRPPSEPSTPGGAPFIPPPTPAPWDPKPAPWQQTQTEAPLDQLPWDRPVTEATRQGTRDEWPEVDLGNAQPIADPYDADAPVVPDVARHSLAPAWPGWNDPPSSSDFEIEPETPAPWAPGWADSPAVDQIAGSPGSTAEKPAAVQPSAHPPTRHMVATVPISSAALATGGSPANLVLRIELAIVEDGNRQTTSAPAAAAVTPVGSPEPAPAPNSLPSFEPDELAEWPSVWEPAMTDAFAPPASQLGPTAAAQSVTTTEESPPEAAAPDRSRSPLLTAGLTVAMALVVVVLVLVFVQLMTPLLR